MANIAIAGGSGQVAREVIDCLIATNKHEIRILTRNDIPIMETRPKVHWHRVDYEDQKSLLQALGGVSTVLSFIQLLNDPENRSQKNLIDACIAAGVYRFAPSEWGSFGLESLPWWAGKQVIRDYLKKVNQDKKVWFNLSFLGPAYQNQQILEYTLFQPGLFLDYLASPYKTAKHVDPLDTMVDIQNCRAIVVDGHDPTLTLTSVQDVAEVVTKALEHERTWPTNGGIKGNTMKFSQIIELAERIRGRPFNIERVKLEDLEDGLLEISWVLGKKHDAIPNDQAAFFAKSVLIGFLLSSIKGAWDVAGHFNQIFSDYKFAQAEEFLGQIWEGKP